MASSTTGILETELQCIILLKGFDRNYTTETQPVQWKKKNPYSAAFSLLHENLLQALGKCGHIFCNTYTIIFATVAC